MWVSIAQKLLLDRLCTFLCCLGIYSLHFPFAYAKECTKFFLNSSLSGISNTVRSRKNYHSCSLVGFNYIIQVEKDLLRGGTHAKTSFLVYLLMWFTITTSTNSGLFLLLCNSPGFAKFSAGHCLPQFSNGYLP